jgi:uncharacterized membrane protein
MDAIEILRIIFGLALTLFIPGFAISLVLFSKEEVDFAGRIALSSVLSIAAVLLTALFIDLVLGVDTTPVNLVISLLSLTAFFLIIWFIKSGILIKIFKKIIKR